jgi:ketosteroid isomerase-like protein
MFEENVAVIQAYFAKQGEEDIRLRGLHPEVEWHVRSDLPDAAVYRGQDGFRQLKARFDEVLADQRYQPLEFIDAGPDVVVPLRWTAQGRLSGASSLESFETWVFTVEEDLITTVVEYLTKEEALEAVGLRE